MRKINISTYLRVGALFFRDHPQLWFTALVAIVICGSFVWTSLRFAGIAQDAQEQLFNDRAGWLLDGIVLFIPETLEDRETLRGRLQALKERNATIGNLSIIAPHGDTWRLYVTDTGAHEGALVNYDPLYSTVAYSAWGDRENAYTVAISAGDDRRFVTMRAIVGETGQPTGLVVAELRLSEADRIIRDDVRTSMLLLGMILIVITLLFLRHARIVDFATLYKKQLEVDHMKDSFLGMASHELKSPLTVIRGYIEYLRDDALDVEKRKEFLRRIDVSAEELRSLIDDILDVSRIEMGRLRFSPDYVHPHEVLEEVVDMFSGAATEKGLALTLAVDDAARARAIRVDRGRLKQVIVNMVSNAVKYTLVGSITVREQLSNGHMELTVQDTGVGMSAEEQKKLFEKFYRVEAEETKTVSGTGLGLWITKYMIEHMGGSITVESIKGNGSRFVVSFPCVETGINQTS